MSEAYSPEANPPPATREFFAAVLQGAPEGISVQDDHGRLVYANDAAARSMGLSSGAELLALPIDEVLRRFEMLDEAGREVPHHDLPAWRVLTGQPAAEMVLHVRNLVTGAQWWTFLKAQPIRDPQGRLSYVVNSWHDITGHKLAEAALHRARHEAEEAVRLRDEFLSVAAHELKTPITTLRGFAQLLLLKMNRAASGAAPPDPEQLRKALASIDRQSRKLARLVAQLLDVTRIEAGKLALDLQPADLLYIAEEAVGDARGRAGRCTLTLRAPGGLPVVCDPLRLEQVLINLLDNAIKYSPSGGAIDVELCRPDADSVRLSVSDHGLGVPGEHRERIFDRYYQAHAQEHVSGMGLGLYICREIVGLHGGLLTAEFPEEGGTRFVLTLPAAGPPASARSGGEDP